MCHAFYANQALELRTLVSLTCLWREIAEDDELEKAQEELQDLFDQLRAGTRQICEAAALLAELSATEIPV